MSAELVDFSSAKVSQNRINDWVRKAQQGNVPAFEKIYSHFKNRIYALCLRMAANEALAEELMQEAFIMAWRKMIQFNGESQFATWLHRLTSNLVISYFRVQKNQSLEGEEPELHGGNHEAHQLDLNRDLEAAIAQLPDKARMVLVLHDIEGYKHKEIADKMNISEGTCKAQLHRARNLLKERFI